MKILVLGSGGREHALVWKLKQSARVSGVVCAPGNAGIAAEAECRALDVGNVAELKGLAEELRPDLVVVGPEAPLVAGAADELRSAGFAVVGPGKSGARLEGSKVFAKEFMLRHEVPTAEVLGVAGGVEDARKKLRELPAGRLVVKADGLCAGKGVLVGSDRAEVDRFVKEFGESSAFQASSKVVLIEEALAGEELSYIILTDGDRFVRMAPARDYKRLLDGDVGPNTGGMGSYSVDDLLPVELEDKILDNIVGPTLSGLRREGIEYRGFLYFGLMVTRTGPKVLEFNCRLGDPETQSILLRADFDLAKCLASCAEGKLDTSEVRWPSGASVCVVLASGGYPGASKSEAVIHGLEPAAQNEDGSESYVFHSGTKVKDGEIYSAGGRVLGVAGAGRDLRAARNAAYQRASKISFAGMQFRSDIAERAKTSDENSEAASG
jgi:phosphoribosylamine---glycine ligase